MRRLSCCLFLAVAALAIAGANIYPDPSFEQSGAVGQPRTGKRAGH
jgi:hypothetical protein